MRSSVLFIQPSISCGVFVVRGKIIDLRGHTLLWAGISKSVEEGCTILWGNYHISRHITVAAQNGTGFMLFQRVQETSSDEPSLPVNHDAKPKLHVALCDKNYPDPNSDIQTAFNAILQILDQEKIKCFKVILPSHLPAFIQSGQYGKIFTIYLAGGNERRAIEIARVIEIGIKAAKTHPPLQPPTRTAADCETRQDRGIVDCDFVTYANRPNGNITACAINSACVEKYLVPSPPSRSVSNVSEMLSRNPSNMCDDSGGSQRLFTAPKTATTLRGTPSRDFTLFVPEMFT